MLGQIFGSALSSLPRLRWLFRNVGTLKTHVPRGGTLPAPPAPLRGRVRLLQQNHPAKSVCWGHLYRKAGTGRLLGPRKPGLFKKRREPGQWAASSRSIFIFRKATLNALEVATPPPGPFLAHPAAFWRRRHNSYSYSRPEGHTAAVAAA